MKTSTGFLLLALGATSLNGGMTLPASADSNTPTNTSKCATARDTAPNKHCTTKPKEGDKGSDKYADEHSQTPAQRQAAFIKAHPPTGVKVVYGEKIIGTYHAPQDTVIISGPGYRIVNGVGSGLASGLNPQPGNGGSGGGRGRTSAK